LPTVSVYKPLRNVGKYKLDCKVSSVVGGATDYGLGGGGVGVRAPVGVRFVSSLRYPDSPEVHPASTSTGTRDSFPGGKVAGT
jgi:hypothetical protein